MSLARVVCRPDAPTWFPDWCGQPCAIIAPGPSAKRETHLSKLRGAFRVIAIKECAVDLAPWADVAYGCDAAWWVYRRGLPYFAGLKVAWEDCVATSYPDVRLVRIQEAAGSRSSDRRYVDRILTDVPGVIGAGKSSGFQALNLAVQFGATRIALVGFDLQGSHYYGRNNWMKAGNPDEQQFARCREAYAANSPLLKALGVDVVNVSLVSTLNCFRRASLEQVIKDWS